MDCRGSLDNFRIQLTIAADMGKPCLRSMVAEAAMD
jgi:hypothetical protein